MAKEIPEKVKNQRAMIAEKVISDMETLGTRWMKPWAPAARPYNAISGKAYSGSNSFNLAVVAGINGYTDPRWMTFNQMKKAGLHLKPDQHASVVERWCRYVFGDDGETYRTERDEQGNDVLNMPEGTKVKGSFLAYQGYFNVFNGDQIEGMEPLESLEAARELTPERIGAIADRLIAGSALAGIPVMEAASDRAYFSPSAMRIVVPSRTQFENPQEFCSTLLHEMGHSTGPALGRDLTGRFGSESYAREELVAEMSSIFSAADLGVAYDRGSEAQAQDCYENNIAYLKSWVRAIEDDPNVLWNAAAQAGRAADAVVERYERAPEPGRELPEAALEVEAAVGDLDALEADAMDGVRLQVEAAGARDQVERAI